MGPEPGDVDVDGVAKSVDCDRLACRHEHNEIWIGADLPDQRDLGWQLANKTGPENDRIGRWGAGVNTNAKRLGGEIDWGWLKRLNDDQGGCR